MQQKNSPNIRFKLLAPYFGSLLVIVCGVLWSLYLFQQGQQRVFASQTDTRLGEAFKQAIEHETEQLRGILPFIGASRELQQGWLRGDRQALYAASEQVLNNMRRDHHITHFYYYQPDGVTFLRVHLQERYGDRVERGTLQEAMRTGKTISGLEFGVPGQFVLRVVMPWSIDGRLVGYIELGEEIDHVLTHLSVAGGYGLVLSASRDFVTRQRFASSDDYEMLLEQEPPYESALVLNRTMERIPAGLDGFIGNRDASAYSVIVQDGSHYLASSIPVRDYSGEDAGWLTYLLDISSHVSNRYRLMAGIGLTAFVLSTLLFFFYYFYSGRLQGWLADSRRELLREIGERKKIQEQLIENKGQLEMLVEQRNRSLEESENRYKTLFYQTADALLIIEGNRFVDCNQATLDMLGYRHREELFNTHPSVLSPEFQPDGQLSAVKADRMIALAFERGSHRFEWEHVRKDGEVFPVEVLLTAIPCGDSQLLHVVWRDITERKNAESEIRYQAYYDSLTGLPNRKLLLDRLEQSLITGRRHGRFDGLLFLDLDRFKTINDSLGHSIGDRLLIEVAGRIRAAIWDQDTASRFGGDEFVILLKHLGTDKQGASLAARKIAMRIQTSFEKPFQIQGNALHITCSIGISVFPFLDESADDIIKYADTAMFSAKENGRNQIAFYLSKMHEKVLNRLMLEKDLRNAIAEEQLDVYYQPQVDRHGGVLAVEALLRWQHPELGFINPEEFIAIAEDTGLIFDIGDFVLNRAINDVLVLGREAGCQLKLSVNISPHQFRRDDFVSKIKSLMENFRLETHFLTLEVTEGIAIDNLADTIDKFEQLRHVGVRLSLDDFGTGYSSLVYLKRLPIDELKIDKSFVFDIEDDPQDALL
ncbi:MAG: EAL domain-containing protein, partial [Thiogranum sp.]